jgi:hypothetical protein
MSSQRSRERKKKSYVDFEMEEALNDFSGEMLITLAFALFFNIGP